MKSSFLTVMLLASMTSGSVYVYLNFDTFYWYSQKSVGEVVKAEGEVFSKQPDELLDVQITEKHKVANKTIVKTGDDSTTTIKLKNDKEITISPNSIVEINLQDEKVFEISIMAGNVELANPTSEVSIKKTLNYVKKAPSAPANLKKGKGIPVAKSSSEVRSTVLLDQYVEQTYRKPINLAKLKRSAKVPKDANAPKANLSLAQEKQKSPIKPSLPKIVPKKPDSTAKTPKLANRPKAPKKPKMPLSKVKPSSENKARLKNNTDFPAGMVKLNKNIELSRRVPSSNFIVKSLKQPINFLFQVKGNPGARFFVFTDRAKTKRLYLSKVHSHHYKLSYNFSSLKNISQFKKYKSLFNQMSFDVWAEDKNSKKKVKKVFTNSVRLVNLSSLRANKYRVKLSFNKTAKAKEYISIKKNNLVKSFYLFNPNLLKSLWKNIESIHSIEIVKSIPELKRSTGILFTNKILTAVSDDTGIIRKIKKYTSGNHLAFQGLLSSKMKHLGPYKNMMTLVKKKGFLSKRKTIYFLVGDSLVDIDPSLLERDPSAYNLIEKQYTHAFSEKITLINK